MTKKVLTELGRFDSAAIASHVAAEKAALRVSEHMQKHDSDWSIADMPDEIVASYEAWKQTLPTLQVEAVRHAAIHLVASEEQRGESTRVCPHCNAESGYACRVCGYSRRLYTYPIVRYYDARGERYDVPLDVAGVLAVAPACLTSSVSEEFDCNGTLAATRNLSLDIRRIPASYVHSQKTGELTIDPADRLATPTTIPTAMWQEEKYQRTREKVTTIQTDADAINAFQSYIATDVQKAVERTEQYGYQLQYDKLIRTLRTLGKGTLGVIYERKYVGMGETETDITAVRLPYSDASPRLHLATDDEVRWGVEKALRVVESEQCRDAIGRLLEQTYVV